MDSDGDGIGDLNGITSRLDYLAELGITIIWISPFYKSPQIDNGYDISDYRNIQKEFGTMADFDNLLSEAHKRGLKIVIDLVVNHTSNQHPWFIESRKSRDNPYRNYYIWRNGKEGHEPNNWGSVFSGSTWTYDTTTAQYYLHLFTPEQPDLNWNNPEVRNGVFSMMDWWCRKGIDGFRMDVISMISKTTELPDGPVPEGHTYGEFGPFVVNGPKVHEYLKEMNRQVLSQYDLVTVGETAGVTIEEAKKYAGYNSHELNMVFQFELPESQNENGTKWTDKKIQLPLFKSILSKWQTELDGSAWNSLYFENHDQPRSTSRYGNDKTYRVESAKMLATCLHMQKGTPYIYEGEELGMTNTHFKSLADCRDIETLNAYRELTSRGIPHEKIMQYIDRISRDNARTPMQWSDGLQAGFTTGTPWIAVNPNFKEINAAAEKKDPDSVLNYYKKLLVLRKSEPVIVYGTYTLLLPDDDKLFAYIRILDSVQLLVVCSFSAEQVPFTVPGGWSKSTLLISNYTQKGISYDRTITLRPYEAVVLKKQ